MTVRRWIASAATSAIAVLTLAACVSIPNGGPVNEGSGAVASSPQPFVQFAEGPRVDDSPLAIVSGFVNAASAGFVSDFTVAKDYLTPQAASSWDPYERVIVFDSGDLTPVFDDATDTVTYDVPVLAVVDDSGRLTEATDGTREPLTFEMEQDENGQWRIAELENGSILAASTFERHFSRVNLIFASIDETTQVPELRWLPTQKASTLAARELIEGPSEWLAPAVRTGFPATSALEVDSVLVTGGVAAVQLTAGSAGTAHERSLATEQMELTLASIPGVSAVTLTAGGLNMGDSDDVELAPAPLPSTDAVAFVGDRLGLFDGQDLWQVSDGVGSLPARSRGIAQMFDDRTAAWIVDGSELVVSSALEGGESSLEPAGDEGEQAQVPVMESVSLAAGSGLIGPSADRHGWLWTIQSNSPDAFTVVRPDGTSTQVAVDWLRGTSVQAIGVSRGGARIIVLSRDAGKQVLEVASIVRDADGAPLTIGEPQVVGADLGTSIDVVWVDELSVAVLGEASGDTASDLWLVDVGGLTTAQKAVTGAVDLTAREKERSLLVTDGEGRLFARSGTVWSPVANGVRELSYSG